MFGLNVTYILAPGKREEFLAELSRCGVQEDVRKEDGCLQYDLFIPVEDENKLLLVEKWTTRAAQKIHLTQPHMDKMRAAKESRVTETLVEGYDLP